MSNTKYLRCACCSIPAPVVWDGIGLSATCPRTHRVMRVKTPHVPLALRKPQPAALPLPLPQPRKPKAHAAGHAERSLVLTCSPCKLLLIAGAVLLAFFVAGIASGLVVKAANRKREDALARRTAAESTSPVPQTKPTRTEPTTVAARTAPSPRLPLVVIAAAPMPREVTDLLAEPAPAPRPVELALAPEPRSAIVAVEPRPVEVRAAVQPVDRCRTFDTKVRFHPTIVDAKDQAKKAKKLVFVLHISGDFDDPGFT